MKKNFKDLTSEDKELLRKKTREKCDCDEVEECLDCPILCGSTTVASIKRSAAVGMRTLDLTDKEESK